MVANRRIADLIRENQADEITDAIAEGEFFHMQTLTAALIELVLTGDVDREVAAAAAPNHHDFVIALERALKEQAAQEPARRKTPSTPNRRRPCASRDAPPPVRRGRRAPTRRRRRLLAHRDARRARRSSAIVVGALTQLFVSASNAQVDMTRRFEAQQEMRLALDKLRREIHCAQATARRGALADLRRSSITLGALLPDERRTGASRRRTSPGARRTRPAYRADPALALRTRSGATAAPRARNRPRTDGRLPDDRRGLHGATPRPPSGSLGEAERRPAGRRERRPTRSSGYVLKDDIVLRNTPRP